MAYITEYYIDLKLVDGSAPTKGRLVFYDRRTDTKILTVAAADIPDSGIVEVTTLDPTIPTKQIYAILFDDVGNRQLAGADKLTIKSRQKYVDSAPIINATFAPGVSTNDSVTNTPLSISSKYADAAHVNNVLTNFAAGVPTITEDGLLCHGAQTNYLEYGASGFDTFTNMTQTVTTERGMPLLQLRETAASGNHIAVIRLNTFGNNMLTWQTVAKLSFDIKLVSSTARTFQFDIKNGTSTVASFLLTPLTMTLTTYNILFSSIQANPKNPGYYRIHLIFLKKANVEISDLAISSSYLDTMLGMSYPSYGGDITKGYDITDLCFTYGIVDVGAQLPIVPSTTATSCAHTLGSSATNISYNYYYDTNKFPLLASVLYDGNSDVNRAYTIMIDLQFRLFFPPFHLNTLGNVVDENFAAVMVLLSKDINGNPTNDMKLRAVKADKEVCALECSLTWSMYDELRVRAWAGAWDDIPADVKTFYGLTQDKFTPSGILVVYQNLTKGTKQVKFDIYRGISTDYYSLAMIWGNSNSIGRGSVAIKHFKMWTKPLPSDWVMV